MSMREDLLPLPLDESAKGKASFFAFFLQFVVGGAIGALAVPFALRALPDVTLLSLAWLLPAVVLSIWLHILFHEAGHALAGMAAGFRAVAFGVGPLRLERGESRWALRWGGGMSGIAGFAMMVPPAGAALRRGAQAAYLLGGATMNLLLAGLAIVLLLLAPELTGPARGAIAIFAMIGVLLGVLNLMPFSAAGWMSDGAGLRQLWRAPDEALAMFRWQQLLAASLQGQRPRDWPESLLPHTASAPVLADNSVALGLAVFRLSRALDAGDDAQAEMLALALAQAWPKVPEMLRPAVAFSLAGYAAERSDATLLRAWRPLATGSIVDESAHKAWLEAELAQLECRPAEAAGHCERAQAALAKVFDAGSRVVLAERLELLRRRISEAV